MPMSRPSLAIAGVAGFALLAGLVIHSDFGGSPAVPGPCPRPPRASTSPGPARVKPITWTASRAKRMWQVRRAPPTDAEAIRSMAAERGRLPTASTGIEREHALARICESNRRWKLGSARPRSASRRAAGPSAGPCQCPGRLNRRGNRQKGRAVSSRRTAACTRPTPTGSRGRDRFASVDPNPVKVVAEEPVSTFSIDVDTASYGFVRASLNDGVLPQEDAVRGGGDRQLLPLRLPRPREPRDAVRGERIAHADPVERFHAADAHRHPGLRPRHGDRAAVRTSSSSSTCRVRWTRRTSSPLVVNSFKLLLGTLAPEDTVAVVVYAGAAGTVLPPTPVAERGRILAALEHLDAGGSTAGGEGIPAGLPPRRAALRRGRDQPG